MQHRPQPCMHEAAIEEVTTCEGSQNAKNRRYDVEGLIARTGTRSEETSVKDKYLQAVLEKACRDWHEEANVEDKWLAVRSGLVNAAGEELGEAGCHQPDWSQEFLSSLKSLLEVRNAAYSRWLGSGRQADLRRFRKARGTARRAIREAKNTWFLRKAEEIERERFGGKKVWKAIRDM